MADAFFAQSSAMQTPEPSGGMGRDVLYSGPELYGVPVPPSLQQVPPVVLKVDPWLWFRLPIRGVSVVE
jgi:hypothetical protein